jgi:hypothetical protein
MIKESLSTSSFLVPTLKLEEILSKDFAVHNWTYTIYILNPSSPQERYKYESPSSPFPTCTNSFGVARYVDRREERKEEREEED